MPRSPHPFAVLLACSGAAALGYEVVWLRRLGLMLGGSAVAASVTLAAFMAGLALGSAATDRLGLRDRSALLGYAAAEALASAWALAFPLLLGALAPMATARAQPIRWIAAGLLLIPPATALGATWPLLARQASAATGALLYAANTFGAVAGVILATFVALPGLGVRGTEIAAALVGLGAAIAATRLGPPPADRSPGQGSESPARLPLPLLGLATAAAGLSALGLEVVWFRLAAVALGATVQANGWVLATFLATLAAGAALGRRWPTDPVRGLILGLAGLGGLALAGALVWGWLPYLVAGLWRLGGPEIMLPGSVVIAMVAMAGAPASSGLAFSAAVRCLGPRLEHHAGLLYAANTVGSISGALLGGLIALPLLELRGAVWLFSGIAMIAASAIARSPWPVLVGVLLALAVPRWDARLYAVGVHLRISDFEDPSTSAIERFADEGWELLRYDHGRTGAVAVGRSLRTGNTWLSINGKVDASTGADMPTQLLSGQLPVRLAEHPAEVLVVGLASGITAGAVLAEEGVEHLTVVELEPAVIEASRYFDAVSGAPLADPRTKLWIDDARAVLTRSSQRWDVIISEPSNPWITGVSSLFTLEYWQLVRRHLAPGGVACQWIQLYGMGPDELRGLLRTFLEVFPDAVLVETIEGSDVLLLGGTGGGWPAALEPRPLLGPAALARVAGAGWLNTDDRPRVEWAAPRWLHYDTGPMNAEALRSAIEP
ncbi:MAG TPA: hypothetical protein ENK18_25080 [Deltaproteobacteria bacterium]|nr:hypothetical protein [Deltaproteobacteria bacterium]